AGLGPFGKPLATRNTKSPASLHPPRFLLPLLSSSWLPPESWRPVRRPPLPSDNPSYRSNRRCPYPGRGARSPDWLAARAAAIPQHGPGHPLPVVVHRSKTLTQTGTPRSDLDLASLQCPVAATALLDFPYAAGAFLRSTAPPASS